MTDFDKILPITQAKKSLLELVKKTNETQGPIAITRKGFLTAVLLSMDEYEGLLETIEILSDDKLMKNIRKSKSQLGKGQTISHDEVWES